MSTSEFLAWWCPQCKEGVALGEESLVFDLPDSGNARCVCYECGTELEPNDLPTLEELRRDSIPVTAEEAME